jgi:hypothetical protein
VDDDSLESGIDHVREKNGREFEILDLSSHKIIFKLYLCSLDLRGLTNSYT